MEKVSYNNIKIDPTEKSNIVKSLLLQYNRFLF